MVTARNSGGAATVVFRVSVTAAPALPAAPAAQGVLPDLVLEQGTGERTVSTQAGFAGEELVFALVAAPAGVSIETGSGLVRIADRRADRGGAGHGPGEQCRRRGGAGLRADGALDGERLHRRRGARRRSGFLSYTRPDLDAAAGRVRAAGAGGGGPGARHLEQGRGRRALPLPGALERRPRPSASGARPFSFNARLSKVGAGLGGLKVDVLQPSAGVRSLEIAQYIGGGTKTTVLATAAVGWQWNTWYWVEVEVDGTSVQGAPLSRGRRRPRLAGAGTTTYTAAGAFGPGGFPLSTGGPSIDIKRLEFVPLIQGLESVPPAAQDADWSLGQFTEPK